MVDHRDFDDVDGGSPAEPSCTFTLAGRTWTCRNRDDMPWNHLNTIYTVGDDDTVVVEVERFFRGALVPDDIEPFMAMLNDPASAVTERKIKPLIEFVTEHIMGRPTKPSSRSRRGSGGRKRKSAEASSGEDTPPLASVG